VLDRGTFFFFFFSGALSLIHSRGLWRDSVLERGGKWRGGRERERRAPTHRGTEACQRHLVSGSAIYVDGFILSVFVFFFCKCQARPIWQSIRDMTIVAIEDCCAPEILGNGPCLDHVERVDDQHTGDTGNGSCSQLGDESEKRRVTGRQTDQTDGRTHTHTHTRRERENRDNTGGQ